MQTPSVLTQFSRQLLVGLILGGSLSACGPKLQTLEQPARAYTNPVLEPFVQIDNQASLPVYVYPSEEATPRVEFTAPPKLLEAILFENQDSRLTIKHGPVCAYVKISQSPTTMQASSGANSTESPKDNPDCAQLLTDETPVIKIYTPDFQNITNSGTAPVYVAGVTTPSLRVVNKGAGPIEFTAPVNLDSLSVRLEGSGDVEFTAREANNLAKASFTNQGTGTILADNVRTADSIVQLLGEGDIYTFTTDKVEGSVTGPGTLYLNGRPDTSRLQQIGLNKVVEQGQ